MSEERKLLKKGIEELTEIRKELGFLGNVLGPIVPANLAVLDGWTWKVTRPAARTILTRGVGRVDIIPFADLQGEVGWLHTLSVFFSNPDAVMRFACDNYVFESSPRQVNMLGGLGPNNVEIFCPVYNPATIQGPMYGIMWAPSMLWPYRTQLYFQAYLPDTVLDPTCHIISYSLGRHFIRDRKHFYQTVHGEGKKQISGEAQVRPLRRGESHG